MRVILPFDSHFFLPKMIKHFLLQRFFFVNKTFFSLKLLPFFLHISSSSSFGTPASKSIQMVLTQLVQPLLPEVCLIFPNVFGLNWNCKALYNSFSYKNSRTLSFPSFASTVQNATISFSFFLCVKKTHKTIHF